MCIGILILIFFRSANDLLYVRLIWPPSEADPMTQATVFNITAISCSWTIVLAGLFVVLRHGTLVDRIVQQLSRIPKLILIGIPIAAFTALNVWILFNLYMTSGHALPSSGHGKLTAFRVSNYAYSMSLPTLLLVAGYVLHRSEQRRTLV